MFVTAAQRWSHPELIRRAEIDGKHVFVIPDALAARLRNAADGTVTTLERFAAEWNERVVIEPLDPARSTQPSGTCWTSPARCWRWSGAAATSGRSSCPRRCTSLPTARRRRTACGNRHERRIVINRRCLQSRELFVATLLHEIGHAITGATDLTAEFEDGLTDLLGTVGTRAVTTL